VSSTAIQDAIERDVAAAAETDTGEPEAAEVEQAEQAPAEGPPMGAKELAALGKKIDAENERHEKRLRELYGDAFEEMRDCPLCLSEGFVPPLTADALPPEQVEAVRAALGENEQPELLMLEGVERCPKCDGWGEVETPARNAANRTKPCLACDTRGYREQFDIPAPAPLPPPWQAYANGASPPPPVWGEVDAWNRPAGHPHYGRDPASVT
jgi:hypothetical protein